MEVVKEHAGASHSLWMTVNFPEIPKLNKNLKADVCIVGAGIAGLTSAYNLLKEGKSVIILDQAGVGSGQTGRTSGHLTWVLDDEFSHLEKLFGEKGSRLALESHREAVDVIEKIVNDEKIDCDFERVDSYLFVPPDLSKDILDKEKEAMERAGQKVSKVKKAPLKSFDTGDALLTANQAQIHSLKYLRGLIDAILKLKGEIFIAHVNDFEETEKCIVKADNKHSVTSDALIVATTTPVNNRYYIHTKQVAYRTYVLAASIPKGSVTKALYWDTGDPYHYIRLQKHSNPDLDWLIVGGEDHKTGQDPHVLEKYDLLEKWMHDRFPNAEVQHRWSGQVYEPFDSLAYIGKNPGNKNVYIVTGDSGHGLTHGTIAGKLIPDVIQGRDNPYKELYDPSRKTVKAGTTYLEDNLNTALQYRDWLTPGEVEQVKDLKNESGVILREGAKKLAVFKDKEGKVHIKSAVCPHLYGCVRWNEGEKCWDCPCHGSQFDGEGMVITGPAISDLPDHK